MWISHPRSKKKDTMLTLSVYAFLAVLGKFLLNGVNITIMEKTVDFGTVDAALIGALLVPTLGAYTARKFKSPPPDQQNGENQ